MSRFKIPTQAPSGSGSPEKQVTPSVDQFIGSAALSDAVTQGRPLKPIRLNLDLAVDLHRRLKIRAAERGISISQLVRNVIERELDLG